MERPIRKILTCLIAFSMAALTCSMAALAGEPSTPSTPAPKLPPELAKRVQEITDAVLEHHIDPPARQQMILSGIKAFYQAAGVPVPAGLSRRVSALATPEQIAAFLAEAWPKSTAKPVAVRELEEALLLGLRQSVPGGTDLISEKERKVAEQLEGNRYVGIHVALSMDDQEKRPKMSEVFEGGPADRARVKKNDLLEEVDGVDTKGMPLAAVIDRTRGAEGTDVTIKVRQPKESKARTMKITRGQHPHPTISGVRKRSSGGWDLRLDGSDPMGYLRITEIAASTPHELRKLAMQLESEGARALVLDLRGFLGANSVHPAVLLADSLLERGPIGRVRTAQGELTYQADPDALFRDWPIVVLVDSNTSGTAEWLAAALQDNHRAILVGTPTSGTMTPGATVVRSTIPVGDGAWSISLQTGRLERGDGRPLGAEMSSAGGGERGFVLRAADPDELERVAKQALALAARASQTEPSRKTNAPANRPSFLGEDSKTGVKPDYLIGEPRPGAAGPTRPRSLGQNRELITDFDKPLEKAVELLRQSLKKPRTI